MYKTKIGKIYFQMEKSQTKSKERVRERGEVFTAEREVKAMCDLVKDETERIDSRFLEPACGDGNFLAEILTRKLEVVKRKYKKSTLDYEKNAVLAISSVYGVDIMQDNVLACPARLFKKSIKSFFCFGERLDKAMDNSSASSLKLKKSLTEISNASQTSCKCPTVISACPSSTRRKCV